MLLTEGVSDDGEQPVASKATDERARA